MNDKYNKAIKIGDFLYYATNERRNRPVLNKVEVLQIFKDKIIVKTEKGYKNTINSYNSHRIAII